DSVGSRIHFQPDVAEAGDDFFRSSRQAMILGRVVFFAAERTREYLGPIQRHDHLVRVFESLQVNRVSMEADVELVFAVQREVVLDCESSASAQQQTFYMGYLRMRGGRFIELAQGRRRWIANGQRTYLVRCGEVLLQERL